MLESNRLFTELEYMDIVASLGCIACKMDGNPGTPAELHHKRAGLGTGMKAQNWHIIPLCPAHHRGTAQKASFPSIHMNKPLFIKTYGSENELMATVGEEAFGVWLQRNPIKVRRILGLTMDQQAPSTMTEFSNLLDAIRKRR